MNSRRTMITLIVVFTAISAGIACVAGIRSGLDESTFTFMTARGETLEFQSEGVYRYNPRWFVAEGIGWDIATLVVGIPVLLISLVLFLRESLRGGVVLGGMLAYFAYQYLMYVTGWTYNNLFLLYVALYSLPIVALILVIQEIGVGTLARRVSEKSPVKGLAGFMFASAGFLLLMWLGKIVPALMRGETPEMLRGVNTLIAQALDLGIIVPFTLAAGILLLRRNAWGYLLASVGIVKLVMMALAIIAMVVVRSIAQGAMSWPEIIIFAVLASVGTGFLVALLRSFRPAESRRAV